MNIKSLGGVILTVVLFNHCQTPNTYGSELKSIDSLQTTLTYIESKLDTFDYDIIKKEYEDINNKYNYLLENYPDKNDRDFWINQMNYMRIVNKSFGRYAESYPRIKEEVKYSRHQLKTLKNSIADQKLTGEEIDQYLETEIEAVNKLRMEAIRLKPGVEASIVIWDSISGQINKVVLSLDSVSQD